MTRYRSGNGFRAGACYDGGIRRILGLGTDKSRGHYRRRNRNKCCYPSIKTDERHHRRCLRCGKGIVVTTKFFRLCDICRGSAARQNAAWMFFAILIFLPACSTVSVRDYLALEKRVSRTEQGIVKLVGPAKKAVFMDDKLGNYFQGKEVHLTRTEGEKCLELKVKWGEKLDWKEIPCQKKK